MAGKRSFAPKNDRSKGSYKKSDIETGNRNGNGNARARPSMFRFRDAVNGTIGDNRRDDLKKALLDNINIEGWKSGELATMSIQDSAKETGADLVGEQLKKIKNKQVRKFYEDQNERLNDWMEVDTIIMAVADDVIDSMNPDPDHDGIPERRGEFQGVGEDLHQFLPEEEKEKRRKANRNATWAININVAANILLLIAKIIAAFYSSSLSLIASLVDSALDLLCTLIVWTTNRLVKWRLNSLKRRFPVGRRRLEPLGILVFSILMIVSFLQILQESITKLLPPSGEKIAVELPVIAISAMAATIGVKGVIWFGCKPIKTTQVQALAQDCKTDVIFNTLSLLFPLIGHKFSIWWLDPLGAALLSLFIVYDWGETSFENVKRLSGSAVSPALLKKLTCLAYRFSPVVDGFKCLTAYHAGDGVWAEVDVLLDEKTPLHRAHDVAETLQYCFEGLEEVDRAFVTTDYTSQGPTGHAA